MVIIVDEFIRSNIFCKCIDSDIMSEMTTSNCTFDVKLLLNFLKCCCQIVLWTR